MLNKILIVLIIFITSCAKPSRLAFSSAKVERAYRAKQRKNERVHNHLKRDRMNHAIGW